MSQNKIDNKNKHWSLWPIDCEITAVTPKILALMSKENISRSELAGRLKMSVSLLNRMLNTPNFNYSWYMLSKILGALGYSISGLTINKIL